MHVHFRRSGLPTAHWLGYGSGGLAKYLEKAKSDTVQSQRPQKILDSLEFEFELHCRRWTVISQSVATLVAAAAETLASFLTDRNQKFFLQISEIGLLVHWSCLLSTIGKEMAMLEDFIPVIQGSRVVLLFERSKSQENDEEGKEGVNITPDDLKAVLVNFTKNRLQQPDEVEVTLSVPGEAFDWLQSLSELQGSLRVDIKLVAFLQGVNEQQTLADVKYGVTDFEKKMNIDALSLLEEYMRAFKLLSKENRIPEPSSYGSSPPRSLQSFSLVDGNRLSNAEEIIEDPDPVCSFSDRTSGSEQSFDDLLLMTRHLIEERNQSKDKIPDILIKSGILARRMNGARITSCKSGKDRTSMLHTLEVLQLIKHDATLNGIVCSHEQLILDHLRGRSGVRLANCANNCGTAAYAFNALQLQTFPPDLVPPQGTYGANQT